MKSAEAAHIARLEAGNAELRAQLAERLDAEAVSIAQLQARFAELDAAAASHVVVLRDGGARRP